jgi:pre-mRNA branch site protein p14
MLFFSHLLFPIALANFFLAVLYHQPEKMAKSKEDLAARRESLAQLKQQHGID